VKLVPASRGKGPANRSEALGCLTANLALPGAGSLAAGKSIGYYQLGLAAIGFIISIVTGLRLLQWMVANWTLITSGTGDPFDALSTIWHEIRGPLLGLAIFAASIVWALITSLQILSAHPKNPVPPRIG
jgi:hypothetical protein